MAVKASGSITLSSIRDVSACYRYYLLQSSTLAKPAAPTARPPGGGWDDTEPTYTAGSTNSLYTVDLTVFSDGSYAYSAVSLSSSYEAAKAAWNKAQAAGDTAQEAIDTANGVATSTSEQITQVVKDSQEIILAALSEYTTTSDFESLKKTVSSQLSVMAEKIELNFTQTTEQIKDVSGDLQDRYNEISKYFKFSADGLVIGEEGNEITLKVDNDRISFLDGGLEVAWITNKQLTITDATFLNSLRIGKFAWIPRRSGNLSLVLVGD